MGKYRTLGTFFDRIFRNDLNANFNDIDADVQAQKKRVDDLIVANPQPSEVQDARGGFTVLRDRLNDTDAQLAENAEYQWNKAVSKDRKKQAMVTFVSDDARLEDYTVIKDIFNRNGKAPFVTAVVTSFVGTNLYCTKEQLLELQNNFNWDIVSHTHTHRHLATLTEQEVYDEMRLSSEYLKNNGFKGRCLCIPYGSYGDREKLIGGKYYRAMRISASGEFKYNTPPIETFELKTVWFANSSTVDTESGFTPTDFNYYKYYIDKAVTNNGWLILSTHSWEIKEWGFEALLEQVLQYAQSATTVLGMEAALDRIENVIDSGLFNKLDKPYQDRFVVGANGVASSPQLNTLLLEFNSVNNNTPISSFKANTLSICNIQLAAATGFPNNERGLLLTYRFSPYPSEYAYCFQEYKTYNNLNKYIRYAKADGTWEAWTLVGGSSGGSTVVTNNNILSTSTLADFQNNAITISEITVAKASGFPETKSGLLTTYKFTNADASILCYQTFKRSDNNNIYVRRALSTTTWGAWESEADKVAILHLGHNVGINGSTPLSSFPSNKVSIVTFTTANADAALPVQVGGSLTTYYINFDAGFCYQEYKKYGTNEKWIRPATSATAWGTWQKYTVV